MSWWRKQLYNEPLVRIHYVTWNTAFEATPAGGDTPTQGDDRIRETKEAVRERLIREHIMDLSSGLPAEDGEHRQGSAKTYSQSAAPTLQPDATTTLTTDDEGRLWIDTDVDLMQYWDGTAWVGLQRVYMTWSVEGTLAVDTTISPDLVTPQAGTITKVTAHVQTAPTGATLIVDINKNGTSTIFDTAGDRIMIAAGTTEDSSTVFDATDGVLAAEDYLTFDVDQVGSTVAGADLSVVIEIALAGS